MLEDRGGGVSWKGVLAAQITGTVECISLNHKWELFIFPILIVLTVRLGLVYVIVLGNSMSHWSGQLMHHSNNEDYHVAYYGISLYAKCIIIANFWKKTDYKPPSLTYWFLACKCWLTHCLPFQNNLICNHPLQISQRKWC